MSTLKHVDFEVPGWSELAKGPQPWRAYHEAVLDLEPIAYWRLGETEGITVLDELGTNNGIYRPNDGSAWVGGVPGVDGALFRDADTAASFESAGPGWVELPFIAPAGPFAVIGWLKSSATASGAAHTLFSWGQDSAQGDALEFRLFETSGGAAVLQLQVKDAGGLHTVQGSTNLRDAQWHHAAVSHDGATASLYADGQLESSSALSIAPLLHHMQIGLLRRGDANLANPVKATLDEIALFDHALTAGNIADLHRRGVGRFKPLS